MKLKVKFFPGCGLEEEAIGLGIDVAAELGLEFEFEPVTPHEIGSSPTFYLDGKRIYPPKTEKIVCDAFLPSEEELIRKIRRAM